MATTLTLTCPVRGLLKTGSKSKDGLKPSEEYYRVEAIRHLIKIGYPKENFKIEAVVKRFGNAGRNSMRADFAVLDVPVTSIGGDVDELLDHAVLLCEVKRENEAAEYVKNTQVKPLLDFAKLDACISLYWDNVDQRIFWRETANGRKSVKEAGLALLPKFGGLVKVKPLTFADTTATDSLLDLFDRIENLLHIAAIDPEARYGVLLQLLLAKLFDEHGHQGAPKTSLDIQDFGALGHNGSSALNLFNSTLAKAVGFYARHLPKAIDKKLPAKVSGDILIEICKLLAPVRLIASKRDVIQVFYMKFAKGLYKWDLAQFFTPPTVTDFIVDVLNPQFGEHVKDPACGSADFLTAAFHKRRDVDKKYADCIWGSDNSKNAVQVAVLNMLLNGDGKSNIKEEDSLENVDGEADTYDIMVCNPPFGVKIVEKRPKVLRKFDLGYEYEDHKGGFKKNDKKLADAQETGLLFVEACLIQAKAGGRIGIILPNGYLGNRSRKYRIFRNWLLRNCKVVAIASFPRFTFKTSGADVSASVVYLEKREKPLKQPTDDTNYRFSVQMIENVGWNLGDKKAAARYKRDQLDGSYIIGSDGNKILDSDFVAMLDDMRHSAASEEFPWLIAGMNLIDGKEGWSVSIKDVVKDDDLTLDPKRHCRKLRILREEIAKSDHFNLGDLVDFIPEHFSSKLQRISRQSKKLYNYVEIQDIGWGDYKSTELRGWELPSRAKHFCEPGDIYIGSIWGSVSKWCIMPKICDGYVVTNGCHRLRIKENMEIYLTDLVSFFCSEAYCVQMRSFSRGSDGLAEVTPEDTKKVLVPKLSNKEREILKPYVDLLIGGASDLRSKVLLMMFGKEINYPVIPKRPSHVVLV
jgi:type I restriction enzyme M protein